MSRPRNARRWRFTEMKFITEKPWQHLTAAVRKAASRCRVAVAYFGQDGSRLLPLQRGSTLVVDFSEASIKGGRVCPTEVLKLIRRGVEVHSVSNLHAKVFVVGRTAYVGSTNVSNASAEALVEAVACSSSGDFVREAREFVDSLKGEHVTPEHARAMAKIYRPPMTSRRGKARLSSEAAAPKHARVWLVQLVQGTWSEQERQAQESGFPKAKGKLKSSRQFEVEDFSWTSPAFSSRVRRGELVVQVLKESSRRFLVSPPERVLHIENYVGPRGTRNSIVFTEKPKRLRRKTLARIKQLLGPKASLLKRKRYLTRITDAELVHRLFQLWGQGR
jgi:hypothetical protein